jgi:hypothetical protein
LDIRSSGKTSFTGPKSNLPERIIEIDIIYKKVFLTTSDGNLIEIDIIYIVDVVEGAGRKAKRMVLQCINGVGSNPIEGRTKI